MNSKIFSFLLLALFLPLSMGIGIKSAEAAPFRVVLSANNTLNSVTIPYNTAATLRWYSNETTSCTASNGWSGAKSPVGGSQSTGNLISNRTYTLTCIGPGGTQSSSVTVAVAPRVVLSANNTLNYIAIPYNTAATLRWYSNNATSCSASGAWSGTKSPVGGSQSTGNITTGRDQRNIYTLTCTGPGGTQSTSVTIIAYAPFRVVLSANNTLNSITIPYNTSATLRWYSNETAGPYGICSAAGAWSGLKSQYGGSESTGKLTSTRTYYLDCGSNTGLGNNIRGIVSTSMTVFVGPPPLVQWPFSWEGHR